MVMTLAWLSAFHKITITLVILEGKRVGNVSAERVIPVQILSKEKISIPIKKMSQVGQENESRAMNVKRKHTIRIIVKMRYQWWRETEGGLLVCREGRNGTVCLNK